MYNQILLRKLRTHLQKTWFQKQQTWPRLVHQRKPCKVFADFFMASFVFFWVSFWLNNHQSLKQNSTDEISFVFRVLMLRWSSWQVMGNSNPLATLKFAYSHTPGNFCYLLSDMLFATWGCQLPAVNLYKPIYIIFLTTISVNFL